jgi:ADP-ribose pyrophosphatase YjhB (NUDIX family)
MTEKFKINLIGILFDPKKRKILVGKNFGDTSYSFLDGELKYNEELDKGLKKVAFEKTGYKVHNLG